MLLSEQCWVFQGATTNGYGYASVGGRPPKGKVVRVHRAAYEVLVGPIPDGLDLDHTCRNRRCYNPSHLDPVTRKVNLQRGVAARITHCPQGHEYTEENSGYRTKTGWRHCRRCAREAEARKRMACRV